MLGERLPVRAEVVRPVAAKAGPYGKPIVISTGTNHSQYTVDGTVSDHWTGHAADLGMAANGGSDDSFIGDRIMTACLALAGVPPGKAKAGANTGGLYTFIHAGRRIQCIWNTDQAATTTTTSTSACAPGSPVHLEKAALEAGRARPYSAPSPGQITGRVLRDLFPGGGRKSARRNRNARKRFGLPQ